MNVKDLYKEQNLLKNIDFCAVLGNASLVSFIWIWNTIIYLHDDIKMILKYYPVWMISENIHLKILNFLNVCAKTCIKMIYAIWIEPNTLHQCFVLHKMTHISKLPISKCTCIIEEVLSAYTHNITFAKECSSYVLCVQHKIVIDAYIDAPSIPIFVFMNE